MAGFGALADLEFDHLDLIVGGDAREFFRIERAVAVAATEIAGANLPNQIAAIFAMIGTDATSPVSCANPPFFAPAFSARTALGLSAPKLIAEILKTDAEYGLVQSGPRW